MYFYQFFLKPMIMRKFWICKISVLVISALAISPADADEVAVAKIKSVFNAKAAYGCFFSATYIEKTIASSFGENLKPEQKETLSLAKSLVANYGNILMAFSSEEDKKEIAAVHNAFQTTSAVTDVDIHFNNLDKCEARVKKLKN
jgi:hypothetical protein